MIRFLRRPKPRLATQSADGVATHFATLQASGGLMVLNDSVLDTLSAALVGRPFAPALASDGGGSAGDASSATKRPHGDVRKTAARRSKPASIRAAARPPPRPLQQSYVADLSSGCPRIASCVTNSTRS